jgi:hypothetical protein
MFDSKKSFPGRLTDAVDLLIDFATLGEYGLEPVGRTPHPCGDPSRQRRIRGVRGASGKSPARGVAWQHHASHVPVA